MSETLPLDSPSNAAEFTVSELSGALKRTIEDSFGNVRVRGEVSGYRGPHSSGHAYFSLKDDRARIEAVIWKTTFARLKFRPEEGMEVVVRGRLTTYPGSSKYQIVIDSLEPAGAGALMALLEERKRRLAAEGLFEEGRKRPLPFMPCVIGVVTSPTGAVIRDIIHRISDRFPVHVVVWPVRVQGETTGAEVAAAISGFNRCEPPLVTPDVIIVARGGGSLEDLWGFNDEAVVRAAASSRIPLISAVGHETDWTLIDLAADRRAPTPTGAAEMAVPVKADLEAELARLGARLKGCMSRHLDRRRHALRAAARVLPTPDQLFALPRRRFDEAAGRLDRAAGTGLASKRQRFNAIRLAPDVLSRRLREHQRHLGLAATGLERAISAHNAGRRQRLAALRLSADTLLRLAAEHRRRADRCGERLPAVFLGLMDRHRIRLQRDAARVTPLALRRRMDLHALAVERLSQRRDSALARLMERLATRFAQASRLVDSLSHKGILARGFVLVTRSDGTVVREAAATRTGETVNLNFVDGAAAATIGPGEARRTSGRARPDTGTQGSLF